jgi:hypothetical protein
LVCREATAANRVGAGAILVDLACLEDGVELVEGARAAEHVGHDHARPLLLLVAAGGQD